MPVISPPSNPVLSDSLVELKDMLELALASSSGGYGGGRAGSGEGGGEGGGRAGSGEGGGEGGGGAKRTSCVLRDSVRTTATPSACDSAFVLVEEL